MLHMNKQQKYKDAYNALVNIIFCHSEYMIGFTHGQASGVISYGNFSVQEWDNYGKLARKIAEQKLKEINK